MSYASVDPQIQAWAQRHSLRLSTSWAGGECRFAYVSSKVGDCFQFWIDQPVDGRICVHVAGVDGQWSDDPAKDWKVSILELDAALEDAFATVLSWMVPSERYFPKSTRANRAAKWIKRMMSKSAPARRGRH